MAREEEEGNDSGVLRLATVVRLGAVPELRSRLRGDCIEDSLRMASRNSKEDLGRTMRFPASLLPILKGADADAHETRELILRQPVFLSDCYDVRILQREGPGGLLLAPEDRSTLAYALEEFVEGLVVHLNSSRTTSASCFV
jgi:hypothetical protein